MVRLATMEAVTDRFGLVDKEFDQVLFAIELFDVPWDFGPLIFHDIVIVSLPHSEFPSSNGVDDTYLREQTAIGSDPSWCNGMQENYAGATVYSISDVSSRVMGNAITCYIGTIALERPAFDRIAGKVA